MADESAAPAKRRARAGGKRGAAAQAAPVDATVAPVQPSRQAKQAVVIIHGMGEQVPLETIGDFVDTVYARDPVFGGPVTPDGRKVTSMVPDKTTGSAELRRVTTHPGLGFKRTDFYELYWADIMDDNPLDLVTGWVAALLLRSPFRLPKRLQIRIIWAVLWLLALIVVVAAAIVAIPDLLSYLPPFMDSFGKQLLDLKWPVGVAAIAVGGGLLAFRLAVNWKDWGDARLGVPLIFLLIGLGLYFVPPDLLKQPQIWASLVVAGVGWVFAKFIGPYFGDVVRYVRATPRTVERRRLVRERGLKLLRDLHSAPSEDGAPSGDPPEYDRIIIVGHSLGSIIAYDLLLHFWVERGPDHHNLKQVDPALKTALENMDAFVASTWPVGAGLAGTATNFDLASFGAAQQALYAALNANPINWRISDLITLGSPLVHSEFLVVDTPEDLQRAFHDRRFPTSPPRPDPAQASQPPLPPNPPTMLYMNGQAGPYAHFASPFSTVRWVNIHDDMWFPAFGDVVSGPVRPAFGPGVWDYNVRITRPDWLPLLDRIFTHTLYWQWHTSYGSSTQRGRAAKPGVPPRHIELLRSALNLDGKRTMPPPP